MRSEVNPTTSMRGLSRRFSSEKACEEFLFKIRYPDGFVCPRCGSRRGWPHQGRCVVQCDRGHKTSLTAGTALHRTRQHLVTWFHAAYLVSTLTPGISAVQFQRQLGLKRYETAYQMLHKLRSALVASDREALHGEVELDETLIGGRAPERAGRGGDKAIVVGAVEVRRMETEPSARCGRVRLRLVDDASENSLLPFARDFIGRGALIRTDGFAGYRNLHNAGFNHRPEAQGKGRSANYTLNHLDLVFSNLKTWLAGTYHGRVSKKHLQAYLNEYTFRFNRRFWRGPAFVRALELLVDAPSAPTYEGLYKAGESGGWPHPGSGNHNI